MSVYAPASIRTALLTEQARLATVVDNIVATHLRRTARATLRRAGEVDYVLWFFIYGLQDIEAALNRFLGPLGVSAGISGVFCHQTPIVVFPPTGARRGRCELGDLCFIVTYNGQLADKVALGNALLTQVKMEFDDAVPTPQRALYEVEPRFQYDTPPALAHPSIGTPVRDLPPKDAEALAYWEIDPCPWYHVPPRFPWRSSPTAIIEPNHQAAGTLLSRVAFGTEFMDLLAGDYGEALLAEPTNDAWSRIVWDLLRVTSSAAANRKNLGVHGAPRGVGSLATRAFKKLGGNGGPFVVRNSLAEALALFGDDFARWGKEIESRERLLDPERFTAYLREHDIRGGGEGEPPILGNDRGGEGEGNGGGGNFVLINLAAPPEPPSRPIRKFNFDV